MTQEVQADATVETDLLIIGGGGAGLIAALEAHSHGARVALLLLGDGATPAVSALNVSDPEDEASFFEDILKGGEYLSQRALVRRLVQGAAEIPGDFRKLNLAPAQKEGQFSKRLASGSSRPRSVFMTQESIGTALSQTLKELLTERKIPAFSNIRACKIFKDPAGAVCGVLGLNVETGVITHFQGKAVIIATGGIGRLCSFSTYPRDVGGDGLALAYEVGAELIDMEFIQYEPTVILHPPAARGLLMPTVMLGDGAVLLNKDRDRFMLTRDPVQGEKNQKHVLALAIAEEAARGRGSSHGGVYFDCRPIPPLVLGGYEEVLSRLGKVGIDITKEPVEVGPVAHSFMGGIWIREDGSTSVPGLYAAGEASGGIWGANRIAGTGGTEIMVFGKTAGRAAATYAKGASVQEPVEGFSVPRGTLVPLPLFHEIQTLLADCGGLGRDRTRLEKGIRELERIEKDALERVSTRSLAHLLTYLDAAQGCVVARMVLGAALRREETRGFHKRLDYPRKNDRDFLGNFVIQKDHLGRLATRFWPHGR